MEGKKGWRRRKEDIKSRIRPKKETKKVKEGTKGAGREGRKKRGKEGEGGKRTIKDEQQ